MKALPANRLLETLSPVQHAQLMAATEPLPLPAGTMLYQQNLWPKYAYFLTGGTASVVMSSMQGQAAEVGILGREGVAGAVHLLGALPLPTECYMQIAGSGRRLLFTELKTMFMASEPFRERLLEFIQLVTLNTMQLAACNALHPLNRRLSRWLLVLQDRVLEESFHLTHEFMAEMLAVQRPTLSNAAAVLQREGIISYRHGNLRILDRLRLEGCACDCYDISRNLLQRLYASHTTRIPDPSCPLDAIRS